MGEEGEICVNCIGLYNFAISSTGLD